MKKKYIEQDVYTATLQRIKLVFDNFTNILVAFSCGKDSGVLLNMVYDYAKENNLLDRMGMYYMDYEADFEETDKFAYRSFCENFEGIKKYLKDKDIEGIVWHRDNGDMVKIKKKDFGFKR